MNLGAGSTSQVFEPEYFASSSLPCGFLSPDLEAGSGMQMPWQRAQGIMLAKAWAPLTSFTTPISGLLIPLALAFSNVTWTNL